MLIRHPFEIIVLDGSDEAITGAKVSLQSKFTGERSAEFDSERELYFFVDVAPGFYEAVVEFDEQSETRTVQVHPRHSREFFTLIPSEQNFIFRGGNRIPFQQDRKRIGLFLRPDQIPLRRPLSITDLLSQQNLSIESWASKNAPDKWKDGNPFEEDGDAIEGGISGLLLSFDIPVVNLQETVKILREFELTESAGPIFLRTERALSFFTGRLTIAFRPGVNSRERATLLEEFSLTQVRGNVVYLENGVLAKAPANTAYGINRLASQIAGSPLVEFAEPELAETPEANSIEPANFLWPGAWDRHKVGTCKAWKLLKNNDRHPHGDPGIIMGITESLPSKNGIVKHRDFEGLVSNGSPKIFKLYDFRNWNEHHDGIGGTHGIKVGSVASAIIRPKNKYSVTEPGIAGIAPNIRLLAAIRPKAEIDQLDMFLWMAGLDSRCDNPNFPEQITPGSAIIAGAYSVGQGAPLAYGAKAILKRIARLGRHGKGCLLFFVAGNKEMEIRTDSPYGTSDHTFACAASSLDPDRKEIRAEYSNFSKYGHIEWCAPSSTETGVDGIEDDRPDSYGVWSAYPNRGGHLPSFPILETFALEKPKKDAIEIVVDSTEGMSARAFLMIGEPGDESEVVQIANSFDPQNNRVPLLEPLKQCHQFSQAQKTKIYSGTFLVSTLAKNLQTGDSTMKLKQVSDLAILSGLVTTHGIDSAVVGKAKSDFMKREEVKLRPILNTADASIALESAVYSNHDAGSEVTLICNGHSTRFGGTSSATPLCAGIAALVLTANPDLTWVEVREILRETAEKDVDGNNFPWLDENLDPVDQSGGEPFYNMGVGYGRLNAEAAVGRALAYDQERDLMIRTELGDQGEAPMESNSNSPDIWVRTLPPNVDAEAVLDDYEIPGSMQNPKFDEDCWIYVRIRNRGKLASLDASVRIYVSHFKGEAFQYPRDFDSVNGRGNRSDHDWDGGTWFIGEVQLPAIAPDGNLTINHPWPASLIPPELTAGGEPWKPRLIVEITPFDGPLQGKTVSDNNNLAEKSIDIEFSSE